MKTLTILLITVAFVATSVSAADIGGPICYACETLVNKLEDYISGGHTADEVKAWIDSYCEDIPLIPEHCKEWANEAIDYINNNIIDAKDICKDLGAC